jgi:hypothetical protein
MCSGGEEEDLPRFRRLIAKVLGVLRDGQEALVGHAGQLFVRNEPFTAFASAAQLLLRPDAALGPPQTWWTPG